MGLVLHTALSPMGTIERQLLRILHTINSFIKRNYIIWLNITFNGLPNILPFCAKIITDQSFQSLNYNLYSII